MVNTKRRKQSKECNNRGLRLIRKTRAGAQGISQEATVAPPTAPSSAAKWQYQRHLLTITLLQISAFGLFQGTHSCKNGLEALVLLLLNVHRIIKLFAEVLCSQPHSATMWWTVINKCRD